MPEHSRRSIECCLRLCRGRWTLPAADLAAWYGLSAGALLRRVETHGPLPGELGFFVEPGEAGWYPRESRAGCPPYVFTEHGAVAAAYLVGSEIARERSIEVLRAFARVRPTDEHELNPHRGFPVFRQL